MSAPQRFFQAPLRGSLERGCTSKRCRPRLPPDSTARRKSYQSDTPRRWVRALLAGVTSFCRCQHKGHAKGFATVEAPKRRDFVELVLYKGLNRPDRLRVERNNIRSPSTFTLCLSSQSHFGFLTSPRRRHEARPRPSRHSGRLNHGHPCRNQGSGAERLPGQRPALS